MNKLFALLTTLLITSLYTGGALAITQFSGPYDPANWTTTITDNGSVDTSGAPNQVVLTGADGAGCGGGGNVDFTITVPSAGNVAFDWFYTTTDGPFWDPFGYLLNGSFVTLTNPGGPGTQNGSEVVAVNAGDIFGFRQNSVDCIFGAGVTTAVNFDGPVPWFQSLSLPAVNANTVFAAPVGGQVDLTHVAPGTQVNITITDQNGTPVVTAAVVDALGNFTATFDASGLLDGPLNALYTAALIAGGNGTGATTTQKDALPSDITVSMPHVHSGNNINVPVNGTTMDVQQGMVVTVRVTDNTGAFVTAFPTVDANGNYATNMSLINLAQGNLTVQAQTTDNNGNTIMSTINRLRLSDAQVEEIAKYFRGEFDNGSSGLSSSGSLSVFTLAGLLLLSLRRRRMA